ncbi:DNA-directed RNA polymerases II, IV and V subunit 8B-like [Olea europaea var. sylvestris]|uniref:DNA-directed RNA polymerases II, IV and V subunit 8B-like n=1 Tax=Olea europaea var. sylvestris TaxID=158386 RepID=UPI000C1CF461|nr:DNA-directed RNA polymerases II, IV and V subunit 8B-like [Olea europaea var. sylvestris]
MAEFHFDEIIKVINIDEKRYEKASCIEAQTEDKDVHLELDVHTELYHMVSQTLSLDGSAVTGYIPEKSLADKFEYVMHGLLYKMSEDKEKKNDESNVSLPFLFYDDNKVVYISFGGLQLMIKENA